jgi:hypothetical protein
MRYQILEAFYRKAICLINIYYKGDFFNRAINDEWLK